MILTMFSLDKAGTFVEKLQVSLNEEVERTAVS